MHTWLVQHAHAQAAALRRLATAPLNTLLSLLVIGIALVLPAAGWIALDNLSQAAARASGVQQISIFLAAGATRDDELAVQSRLEQARAGHLSFVSKEQAMAQLQDNEGMADLLASLPRNPLPDAFVLEPRDTTPSRMEALAQQIATWPGVEHVQLDSAWAHRFDSFLRLGRLTMAMLAGLLAVALAAITFNTIRLQILAQGAEIEVAQLIGATSGYIRRPFYYFGAIQGALGGLLALGLVALGVHTLSPSVTELAGLYGANFRLQGLDPVGSILLVLAGAFLGWLGAQLSVGLYLRRMGRD